MPHFEHCFSQCTVKSLSSCITGGGIGWVGVRCVYNWSRHAPVLKKTDLFKQWAIDGIYSSVLCSMGLISSVL